MSDLDDIPLLRHRTSESPIVGARAIVLPLSENPAAIYLGRLAPGSRRTMTHALSRMARMLTNDQITNPLDLDWSQLRYQHAAVLRAQLQEDYQPAMVNKLLSALRGVLKEAWRLGQMSAEAYQRASDVQGIQATTIPPGRALTAGEIKALLQVCREDPLPGGVRDGAIITVLYGAGLRRSEIVRLDRSDYHRAAGEILIRAGKGRKDRMVPLPPGTMRAVDDWLHLCDATAPVSPLFLSLNRHGTMVGAQAGHRLHDHAILSLLRKRAVQANVTQFSPHDLRRTFISHLLDAGVDVGTVQQLAGHANVDTTLRYDRRDAGVKREAVGRLHIPYVQRFPSDA